MFTDLMQKLMVAIVGVLFLVSAGLIVFRMKNVNRTERTQIFKTAEYFNVWVILICFVSTIFYGVFNHFELKKSVHAVVSLNYSEASQALNSNGTRYNMAEIISDEVVKRAIEKGALEDVTVKELKNCLTKNKSVLVSDYTTRIDNNNISNEKDESIVEDVVTVIDAYVTKMRERV